MTTRARLLAVARELPETVRSSADIEAMLSASSSQFRTRAGVIQAMTGIQERRVAADDVQCSDLAVNACRRVLADAQVNVADVDLLIFASAGQDLIEPATAHIVQAKLGTSCPVFDVKNACNSFLNGMQIADAFIQTGAFKTVLVAVGEVNSRGIDWSPKSQEEFKRNLPGYTMGDAGAAALFAPAVDGSGIFYQEFSALSEHWNLTTVSSGGSMHPRGDEHSYIRANGPRLKVAFRDIGLPFLRRAMQNAEVTYADMQRVFVHQVSLPYLNDMLDEAGIPKSLVEVTVVNCGNMAAASIPVAMAAAFERRAIGPGDRIMCLGLGSGISIGVVMIEL